MLIYNDMLLNDGLFLCLRSHRCRRTLCCSCRIFGLCTVIFLGLIAILVGVGGRHRRLCLAIVRSASCDEI